MGDDKDVLEGQLDIYDVFYPEVKNPLIAVSKIFARAIKQMNTTEWKTFIYALTFLDFTKVNEDTVTLDKKQLAGLLGLKTADSPTDISQVLRRALSELHPHSRITIDNKDKGVYDDGSIIRRVTVYKNIIKIKFDSDYFPLFTELSADKPYITMWANDLFTAKSERSILFYEDLRLHSDTRITNERVYGIKDFKIMFGIPKDGKGSYMRRDGHFDRPAFERYVIDPICADLKACEMIHLHVNSNGKYWQKVHNKHGEVIGYRFTWDISSRPHIATAEEKATLVHEILEEDSRTLAIAMNAQRAEKWAKKKGYTRGGKKEKENAFNNFTQNAYDFDDLEQKLVQNHREISPDSDNPWGW